MTAKLEFQTVGQAFPETGNNKRQRNCVASGAIRKIMKTIIRPIKIVGAVLILSATGVRAQDWSKVYLNADVGGVFQQDATITVSAVPGVRNTATFNPGIRGDITVGYNLNDSLAVELESGVICNSIDKIGGGSISSDNKSFDFCSVPILADVVYKVPTGSAWTPYLGVGAGGVVNRADFRNGGTHYCDTTLTFAYQAKAGVDYALTENVSVGIAYKFLGTPNQRYYLSGVHMKFDGIYTHAVVASFTWKF